MNVSRYFAACSDAVFSLQTVVGLGRSALMGARRLSFAVVRAESDFRAELYAGDVIEMQTGVLDIGGKSATLHHRLLRVEDEALAFESTFRGVLLDLESRRGVPIPDDIRQGLEAFRVDGPD